MALLDPRGTRRLGGEPDLATRGGGHVVGAGAVEHLVVRVPALEPTHPASRYRGRAPTSEQLATAAKSGSAATSWTKW